LDENLGWKVLGDQETAWLYSQTKTLHQLGVEVTYSGDNPFLLRLVLGVANDDTHSSRMPLFVAPDADLPPTMVDGNSGRRHDVIVPFRKEIPPQSLVHLSDIRQICPDITHMMIRLVEFDMKKMAQLLLLVLHPYVDFPLRALEQNLTDRQIKSPAFQFHVDKTSRHPCSIHSILYEYILHHIVS
jgi:hypothetical protein